jgi:MFS transporter, CP family, cyanate transporter
MAAPTAPPISRPGSPDRLRHLAAGITAVMAAVYILIFAGVLSIGAPAGGPHRGGAGAGGGVGGRAGRGGAPPPRRRGPPRGRGPNPLAWLLVLLFALASGQYYGMSAWLAAAYVERGWTEAAAGGLIATLNATAIPAGLLVTWSSDRFPSRAPFLIGCGVAMLTSVLGIVLLPAGGWLWAALFGMAQGSIFALMLTLPVDLGREPREVAAYAGMMFAGGYVLTGLSPVALGAIRDLTGDFTTSLWALVGVAVLMLIAFVGYARLSRGREAVAAGQR